MNKKTLIALADAIREHNRIHAGGFSEYAGVTLDTLADFCQSQNPYFNRDRWLHYVAGECGPNGGAR